MSLNNLQELLVEQLNELYAGEKHAAQVLPAMARVASSPKLADVLNSHAAETKQHVTRLESVFDSVGARPRPFESKGMKGLLEDCLKLAQSTRSEPHVRDAALVAVAQHVEHDEIAGYGCAKTWAGILGFDDAASKLQATLNEERRADTEFTRIAETLNKEAVAPMHA
jgi:ferritin-like metal-binding protein YciE